MATLATYIAFLDNQAKEAFEFYHEVFGGKLDIITYADMPMPGMDLDPATVAHAVLTLPGGVIAGGDAMPGETYAVRDTVYSMLYAADSVEDAQGIIDRIVAGGGAINMAFEPAPWGGHYGQVFDKFGVMWALSVD